MKFLTCIIAALCGMTGCRAQSDKFKSVGVDEYEAVIANADVIRLDVRTAAEYAEGHIAGAINIDVQQSDFEQQALAQLPKKNTIAVNCRSGRRSKKAAEILANHGYSVVELNDGYIGWVDAKKPVTTEEVDLFVAPDGTLVYMYCIKHGTVKMRIANRWVYVDPVADKIPPVTDYTQMPKADVILITHEHPDHLDAKAIGQLTKDSTLLIVNPRSSELLGGRGEHMSNGDSRSIMEGWSVSAVPAYNNSPDKQQFHPKGRDNGYVLAVGGMNIYIAGDTEDIDEMQDLKDIDVAFLPCNLPFTMTPEQLAKAAGVIKPKVLFPYHYGQTVISRTQDLLKDSGIDVRIRQYQ